MIEYYKPEPNDPAYDLLTGAVEEIVNGNNDTLVIGLHPTEHLAPLIAHHLRTERTDLLAHVDYKCGNPVAAARMPQERYTNEHSTDPALKGTDLNRSFSPSKPPRTHEERIAAAMLPTLREYNRVFDAHTSTTDCGPNQRFFLTARPHNRVVRQFIAASTVTDVIILPPDITEPSLIGQVRNSISFECNQDWAHTPAAMKEMMLILDGVTKGAPLVKARRRRFFHVYEPIKREEDPGLETPNFSLCADGYYPVLLGENSYRRDPSKPYVGFKARAPEIIRM